MSGYQPESQMLELWASHRRRMIFTVQPVNKVNADLLEKNMKRYGVLLSILAVVVVLLSGCVARYPYDDGYYGRGNGYRGYGHGQDGYGRRGYGHNDGYGGQRGNGGWHGRGHHHDHDDD